MKNTEIAERARQAIEIVTVKLNPQFIKNRFDEPITKAAEQFEFEATSPITHTVFHNIISSFLKHVYENAFGSSPTVKNPLAWAIWMLESYYHSAIYGIGYTAALLDVDDTEESGLHTVLASLAETIKDIERQQYTQAVFARHLLSADWNLRCEIARSLLEAYEPFLSERLRNCVPAQLADHIPAIINSFMCSESSLENISSYKETTLTAERLHKSKLF